MNLAAVEQLEKHFANLNVVFLESGGDNLAATFSPELVDLTIYVIDVAAGDKIPRKGGQELQNPIYWSLIKSIWLLSLVLVWR